MILVRRFSTRVIQFSHSGTSADIIDDDDRMHGLLADLGCTARLAELRSKRDARFTELGERISAAGFAEGALF